MARGSVKKRNGRWRARYRAPDGKFRQRTFDRKEDGAHWLRNQLADIDRAKWVDPRHGQLLFEPWAEQWAESQLQQAEGTRIAVRSRLDNHILPAFGTRKLTVITQPDIQSWVNSLNRTLAPRTVRENYSTFASIMKAAVVARRIASSPCHGINLPRTSKTRLVVRDRAELEAVASELPERYRRFVSVLIQTGLRWAELAGLTVDRVDFLRGTIRVDRQWKRRALIEPKTASSHRTIPISQRTVDLLAAQLAEFGPSDLGTIFGNERGRPFSETRWSDLWIKAREAAGIEASVTAHDCRHFYASALIRHGCSVRVVQDRLGHATSKETIDTYGHLWDDDDDRTRSAIDAVYVSGDEPLSEAR